MEYLYEGISYKSYGELQIAKYLTFKKFNFTYEKQIKIIDKNNMERLWYPDFYLEDYDIIIEFFGKENDENYNNGTIIKKKTYYKNKYKIIPVYPKTMKGKWQQYLLIQIKKLKNRKLIDKVETNKQDFEDKKKLKELRIICSILILIFLFLIPIGILFIIITLFYWGLTENNLKTFK